MARPRTRFEAASTNSAASNHHRAGGNVAEVLFKRRCRIHLVTSRIPRGIKALTSRSAMPPPTTAGAASHTRRRTGGTLRSAARRRLQELSLDEDTVDHIRFRGSYSK